MRKSRLAVLLGASMAASALVSAPLAAPAAAADCAAPVPLKILSFTDYHGRIATNPDTAVFFSALEQERDANTVVIANGDSIGATLFPSMIQQDAPTIDILNALELSAHSVGNHELDGGYADFTGRVMTRASYPYVVANLDDAAGNSIADAPYQVVTVGGVTVGIVGAVTESLPSLVSPSVFDSATVTPAVTAINDYAAQLKDGDPTNGEADIVIAAFHEDGAANAGISAQVDAIINGHSHVTTAEGVGTQRAVIQPGSYASHVGVIELTVDVDDNTVCTVNRVENVKPPAFTADQSAERAAYIAAGGARSTAISELVTKALADANELGAPVVATATAPITRGLNDDGSYDNRAVESTMSNMIAQMFYDQLSAGDPDFIGVQNPGGTRADFDAGDITYGEAAAILPFANSLMTTQLTGAQIKTMLEQQWQPDGERRPYLALGLSENVSYTYDEAMPRGERILSIHVNGAPIDPAKLYTIGSGSFLISGGDNFFVIGEGINTADTGRADLEAWIDWLVMNQQGTVSPDYAKRGVQFNGETALAVGSTVDWVVGLPIAESLTNQTLDLRSTEVPPNTTLTAHMGSAAGPVVGTATVVDGVATITINPDACIPGGATAIHLLADPSGTEIIVPVNYENPNPVCPVVDPTPTPTPTPTPVPPKPTTLPKTGVAR